MLQPPNVNLEEILFNLSKGKIGYVVVLFAIGFVGSIVLSAYVTTIFIILIVAFIAVCIAYMSGTIKDYAERLVIWLGRLVFGIDE